MVASRRGLAFALAALTSCTRARAPVESVTPAPPVAASASTASAASTPASATPRASDGAPARHESTAVSYGGESFEVSCNGIDDDKDGLVDVLLPLGANACKTSLLGACASGFAACQDGKRVCLAPAPTPEVFDGIDNDCNGQVDDVQPGSVRPRALVLAPRYAWTDSASDVATVVSVLAQAGIPSDMQPAGTDWSTMVSKLDAYSLAIVPGYLLGAAMAASVQEALEQFARRGGIVVVFKPVGTPEKRQAWKLTGLRASERHRDVLEIRFDGVRPAPTTDLDSPEETSLRINRKPAPDAVEVYFFDIDPDAGTEIVAHAYTASASAPTITRRPLGKGAVYAIGHDLATFADSRCYVNCFEPSGDVMRLFLEGAFREGSSGHVVLKHTAPGEMASVLLLTHDVDAPDAQNAGVWGAPGALQMAILERERGVRATFTITTDYVAGYYNPQTLRALTDLGMAPLAAHSVTHPETWSKLPVGTCAETRSTYGAQKTLCGEIRISRDLVAGATGIRPRVWRSPYLALAAHLYELLAKNGFAFDSGFGIGDLPYNLPVDLAAVGFHQDRFHRSPLLEFPVACEDGQGEVSEGARNRVELQAGNRARFASLWRYMLLRNAQNRSFTTVLVHPSRGREQPPENLRTKVEAVGTLVDQAHAAGVLVMPLEEVGDFWRARLDADLDAQYDADAGYSGTLTAGPTSAPGLTLEFGDSIVDFSCAACGRVRVRGKRVVLIDPLPPHKKATFVARVR